MTKSQKTKNLIELEKKKSSYLQRRLRKINSLDVDIKQSVEKCEADKLIKTIQ